MLEKYPFCKSAKKGCFGKKKKGNTVNSKLARNIADTMYFAPNNNNNNNDDDDDDDDDEEEEEEGANGSAALPVVALASR